MCSISRTTTAMSGLGNDAKSFSHLDLGIFSGILAFLYIITSSVRWIVNFNAQPFPVVSRNAQKGLS